MEGRKQFGLDKPDCLITRLLFGFDKLNQSTNSETAMLSNTPTQEDSEWLESGARMRWCHHGGKQLSRLLIDGGCMIRRPVKASQALAYNWLIDFWYSDQFHQIITRENQPTIDLHIMSSETLQIE